MEMYIKPEKIITLYRTEFTYTIERDEENYFLVKPGGKISKSFLDCGTEEQPMVENCINKDENGNLENILKNGEVTINYPNSSEFTGFICCGLPYSGRISYKNGDEFEGEFNKNGIPENGTLYYRNGNIFEGNFDKDGKLYNGELKNKFFTDYKCEYRKENEIYITVSGTEIQNVLKSVNSENPSESMEKFNKFLFDRIEEKIEERKQKIYN